MALSDVFSSNNFHLRVGLALIVGCLVGCASTYAPETAKWSQVSPAAPQPIDGKWKSGRGFIYHFEKGKGRFLSSTKLDPLDVAFRNIQRVGPGKYSVEGFSWNKHHKKTSFCAAELNTLLTLRFRHKDCQCAIVLSV